MLQHRYNGIFKDAFMNFFFFFNKQFAHLINTCQRLEPGHIARTRARAPQPACILCLRAHMRVNSWPLQGTERLTQAAIRTERRPSLSQPPGLSRVVWGWRKVEQRSFGCISWRRISWRTTGGALGFTAWMEDTTCRSCLMGVCRARGMRRTFTIRRPSSRKLCSVSLGSGFGH